MTIELKSPELFFYELLGESKEKFGIRTRKDVDSYVLYLLVGLISNAQNVVFDQSLSLLFLEATENNNRTNLKMVGDTTLAILGMFPAARPTYRDLYYNLGMSSYAFLSNKNDVYAGLARAFPDAVDLLLGVNMIMHNSIEHNNKLWWSTQNDMIKKALLEDNIIPFAKNQ